MTPPDTTFTPDVPELMDLLTRQRDLYLRLKGLSDQQASFIDAGDTEQLLGILSQRQALVDALGRINGDLTPYRESWSEVSDRLPEARRGEVHGLLDEVESLLAGILAQDEAAGKRLAEAQQKIGGELTQAARTGSAIRAYGHAPAARGGARFADHRG